MAKVLKIKCRGRDFDRRKVLDSPVDVKVLIYQPLDGEDVISSRVECEYNCGGLGNNCSASGTSNGYCPYVFDIPHAMDNRPAGRDLSLLVDPTS